VSVVEHGTDRRDHRRHDRRRRRIGLQQRLSNPIDRLLVNLGTGDVAQRQQDLLEVGDRRLAAVVGVEIAVYRCRERSIATTFAVPGDAELLRFERGGFFFGDPGIVRLSANSYSFNRPVRVADSTRDLEGAGVFAAADGEGNCLMTSFRAAMPAASNRV